MRLIATLDEKCHAYLSALLWCSQFDEPKTINFLIDSGCTVTTILSDHTAMLGIDCSLLVPSDNPVVTANGTMTPYKIPKVIMIFEVKKGFMNLKKDYWGTLLDRIHCHPPTDPALVSQYTEDEKDEFYSLLGMDVLSKFRFYRFDYKKRELIISP